MYGCNSSAPSNQLCYHRTANLFGNEDEVDQEISQANLQEGEVTAQAKDP